MCQRGDTVTVEIDGEKCGIDRCIAPIVKALNAAGLKTLASCCGHGNQPSNIALADGREVVLMPDRETARRVERLFPSICGDEIHVSDLARVCAEEPRWAAKTILDR